jgi:hypothetical protein
VVWVIDPWWLNEQAMGQNCVLDPYDQASSKYLAEVGVSLILPALPIAIRPPHVSRRIAAQQSMFTIFGGQPDLVSALPPLENGSRLAKIIVPSSAASSIAGDLERCGISETTLFPDLEALSRELTDYYARDPVVLSTRDSIVPARDAAERQRCGSGAFESSTSSTSAEPSSGRGPT